MHFFKDGKINLTDIKNKKNFLNNLIDAVYKLTSTEVFTPRLSVGGFYHKKYYKYLLDGLNCKKINVVCLKNVLKSEFLYNSKQNLCNFACYFYQENNNIFLEIYSGNSFLIDRNLQNFIEKNIEIKIKSDEKIIKKFSNKIKILHIHNNYKKLKNYKKDILKSQFNIDKKIKVFDYYYLNFLSKLTPFNFNISSENKILKNQIKKLKLKNKTSKFIVKIFKNLEYKIFYESKEIDKKIFFEKYIKLGDENDHRNIININVKNLKNVVNNKFLVYNELTNYFDMFLTLNYISWRIANDKNYTKLV